MKNITILLSLLAVLYQSNAAFASEDELRSSVHSSSMRIAQRVAIANNTAIVKTRINDILQQHNLDTLSQLKSSLEELLQLLVQDASIQEEYLPQLLAQTANQLRATLANPSQELNTFIAQHPNLAIITGRTELFDPNTQEGQEMIRKYPQFAEFLKSKEVTQMQSTHISMFCAIYATKWRELKRISQLLKSVQSSIAALQKIKDNLKQIAVSETNINEAFANLTTIFEQLEQIK